MTAAVFARARMTYWRRRAVMLALLVALLAGGLAPTAGKAAAERAQSDTTSAVAVNEKDGSSLFRFAFAIKRVSGEVADQQNVAIAYSSCEACQTVAISVQILLLAGDVNVVTPQNVAVALNENCTACQSFAAAYQFVFGNGSTVRFTSEGRRLIAQIRRQLRELGRAGLTVEQIRRRTEQLVGELRQVLSTQLVPVRPGDDEDEDEDEDTSRQGDASERDEGPDSQGREPREHTQPGGAQTTPTTPPSPPGATPTPHEPPPTPADPAPPPPTPPPPSPPGGQ